VFVHQQIDVDSFKALGYHIDTIEHLIEFLLALVITLKWAETVDDEVNLLLHTLECLSPLLIKQGIDVDTVEPLLDGSFINDLTIVTLKFG
jgi:hypothetical protein